MKTDFLKVIFHDECRVPLDRPNGGTRGCVFQGISQLTQLGSQQMDQIFW